MRVEWNWLMNFRRKINNCIAARTKWQNYRTEQNFQIPYQIACLIFSSKSGHSFQTVYSSVHEKWIHLSTFSNGGILWQLPIFYVSKSYRSVKSNRLLVQYILPKILYWKWLNAVHKFISYIVWNYFAARFSISKTKSSQNMKHLSIEQMTAGNLKWTFNWLVGFRLNIFHSFTRTM